MQTMTRRNVLRTVAATPIGLVVRGVAASQPTPAAAPGPLPTTALPAGIRSRLINGVNGITMHVLEAGYEGAGRPGLLLVHGFPELAYSWRRVMLPLAAAGY